MATLRFKSTFTKELKGRAMRGKLLNALRLVQVRMVEEFEKTVETWENPPNFRREQGKVRETEQLAWIDVTTDDDIYGLVNEGSPPHFIGPRGDNMIIFHSEYTQKTMPGVIDSFEGGAGPKDRLIEFIPEHPGFPGRHFDQQVAQDFMPLFRYEMNRAMAEAAKASGWAK